MSWIWIGALIVFAGGLIALWPPARRAPRPVAARYAARVAQELGRAYAVDVLLVLVVFAVVVLVVAAPLRRGRTAAVEASEAAERDALEAAKEAKYARDPRRRARLPHRQALRGGLAGAGPRAAGRGDRDPAPARRARQTGQPPARAGVSAHMKRFLALFALLSLALALPAAAPAKKKRHKHPHHRTTVLKGSFEAVGADGAYTDKKFGKAQLVDNRKRDKLSVHCAGSRRARYTFALYSVAKGQPRCEEGASGGTQETAFAPKTKTTNKSAAT